MSKRQLVIVVMATFCLTTLLMMPLVRSTGEPDPWADVSGLTPGQPDGIVNMRDVAYEMVHFNENVTGIPRDVNVTNWPPSYDLLAVKGVNASWTDYTSWTYEVPGPFQPNLDARGFSSMTIIVGVENMSEGNYVLNINVWRVVWTFTAFADQFSGWISDDNSGAYSATVIRFPINNDWEIFQTNVTRIETKGPYTGLVFSVNASVAPGWAVLDWYIYLSNE